MSVGIAVTSTHSALSKNPASQLEKGVWVLGCRHKAEPGEAPEGA